MSKKIICMTPKKRAPWEPLIGDGRGVAGRNMSIPDEPIPGSRREEIPMPDSATGRKPLGPHNGGTSGMHPKLKGL